MRMFICTALLRHVVLLLQYKPVPTDGTGTVYECIHTTFNGASCRRRVLYVVPAAVSFFNDFSVRFYSLHITSLAVSFFRAVNFTSRARGFASCCTVL